MSIKSRRGGVYPPDWSDMVVKGKLFDDHVGGMSLAKISEFHL